MLCSHVLLVPTLPLLLFPLHLIITVESMVPSSLVRRPCHFLNGILSLSLFFFGARACNLPVQISTVRPFRLSAAGFIFCRFVLQNTFADYTARTSFERPLLSGVAYAQRVVHGDRESFERQQGWIIKTMKHEPSPVQDEYAPVVYSQETVSYIEGLDMMSGEVCGQVSCSFLALGYSFFFLLCGCWF